MAKHLDPRVIKTRSSLKAALINLMQQYKIENISVQKITETAHITRGTFYLHYKDKRDFIASAMTEILDDFFNAVMIDSTDRLPLITPSTQVTQLFSVNAAFSYIETEANMFNVLLNTQENGLFEYQLIARLTKALERFHDQLKSDFLEIDVPENIQIAFIVSAYIGLVKNWLVDGLIYTPHYMTSSIQKMTDLVSHDPQKITFSDFFYAQADFVPHPATN